MDTIAQVIADKFKIKLDSSPSVYKEHRLINAVWSDEGWQFSFYSNGNWDIQFDDGRSFEGHTTPPRQKSWVRRLVKRGLAVPFAVSAVAAWQLA